MFSKFLYQFKKTLGIILTNTWQRFSYKLQTNLLISHLPYHPFCYLNTECSIYKVPRDINQLTMENGSCTSHSLLLEKRLDYIANCAFQTFPFAKQMLHEVPEKNIIVIFTCSGQFHVSHIHFPNSNPQEHKSVFCCCPENQLVFVTFPAKKHHRHPYVL